MLFLERPVVDSLQTDSTQFEKELMNKADIGQAIEVGASQDMASELAAFDVFWADSELAGLRIRALCEGFRVPGSAPES